MTRAISTWSRPPREMRRARTRMDNLALVPASELTSIDLWQQRARQLPPGITLVVLPRDNLRLQQVGHQIRLTLTQHGRGSLITTVPSSLTSRS